jgi:hypothetical protein
MFSRVYLIINIYRIHINNKINMNYSPILMKSLPTKIKTLDHNFIYKRIYELLDVKELQNHFYENIYLCFFSQTGFPFENVYNKSDNKTFEDLKYGDVIVLEEIINYSRLYQHVSKDINQFQCLFIEQYLDRNPDPEVLDVWKNKVPEFIEYKTMNNSQMPIYSIAELKNKQELLLHDFTNFIMKHKNRYVQYLFQQFKIRFPEKHETITMQCDNIEKLNELLADEFINTVLPVSQQ